MQTLWMYNLSHPLNSVKPEIVANLTAVGRYEDIGMCGNRLFVVESERVTASGVGSSVEYTLSFLDIPTGDNTDSAQL